VGKVDDNDVGDRICRYHPLEEFTHPIPALIGSSRVRIMTTIVVGLLDGNLEAGLSRDDKGEEG